MPKSVEPTNAAKDFVIQEFPAVGKYRIRLVKGVKGEQILDIREYVKTADFERFTRRGIRLSGEEAGSLRNLMNMIFPPEKKD